MSLADIASNLAEIQEAYEENFMGDRVDIWRYRQYGVDNDGADFDFGETPALTDVPCRLLVPKRNNPTGLDEGGFADMTATLVLPIAYLGQVTEQDEVELTVLQTRTLPKPWRFALLETPRPGTTGLQCSVSLITGSNSNE